MIVTAVDQSLLVESRASPPGWTGETPVPPPYDSSRGHGTSEQKNAPAEVSPLISSQESEIPSAQRCPVHGKVTEWWKRADGDLICNRCHPCPHEGQLIWGAPSFAVETRRVFA